MNSIMNDEFEDRPRVVADAGYTAQKLNRPGEKSLGANNLASLAKSVLQADATTTENNMLKIATNSSRKGTRTAVTKPKPRGGLAARKMELEQEAKNNSTTPAPDAAKPKRGKKAKAPKANSDGAAKPRKEWRGKTKRKEKIFEHSVCSVVRTLGKNGVTKEQAKAILDNKKITMPDASLAIQLNYGKNETRPLAPLTKEQIKELVESVASA